MRQSGHCCQCALAQGQLRESEERFRSTAELAAVGIAHVDAGGRFIFVNRWLCDLLGYAREELLGLSVKQVSHPEDKDVTDEIRARLRSGEINFFRIEKRYLRKDRSTVWLALTITVKRDPSGKPEHDISVYEDITARKEAEARIRHLATHDGLTGLPNRVMFSQLLSQAIASAGRYEREFAVLFIDLDRFKVINDTLGHDAGDKLLGEISARLKDALRSSDVVARLGGDEFVALLADVRDADEAGMVARRVLSAVLRPVPIAGQECSVTTSIGIAMFPGDARDEQTLMKNADTAMYLAKQKGKNNFHFYATAVPSASFPAQACASSSKRTISLADGQSATAVQSASASRLPPS